MESLESLKSLDSLEALENGRILLCFPQSGGSLETLESLNFLESQENGLFWKDPFSKRPLFWAPANPTRNPNPTWNNAFCSVHAMAENAEKFAVFCRFQSNEFQCTKHHRHKPNTKQHEKHHKNRSKPNMKPQTQRETTASRSFITLGSTNSARMSTDTKHTRHETSSSLGRFLAATTVEIASPRCPYHVQQQCCSMWGLVS